jgi:predicted DNA-binding transcriptional regulator YafY
MNQHKIYRVLRLLQMLQEKPRTVMGMARYLGTSERTAYRYLQLFIKLDYNVKRDNYYKYYIEKNERRNR